MASPAQVIEQGSLNRQHLRQQEDFQRQEESRIAQREAMANLHQQVLTNPDATHEQRTQALTAMTGLYQPHEAPSLMQRLGGLLHGQAQAATPAATPAEQPVAAAPAPIVRDPLGIPYSDPQQAEAAQQPLHPMSTDHPVLGRFREALDAVGHHLKGFQQPTAPAPAPDLNAEFAGYKSPTEIQRESADLAAERTKGVAQNQGNINKDIAKIRAGGSSGEARYVRAFAQELGKEPGDLTPEEYQQALRERGEANRKPQTVVDPTTGVVNIVTRDEDGSATAAPMRDADGHLFGGFRPNTVTVKNGVYHFIGADEQVHEVPVTTTTTKIFGPHSQEDKPDVLHKRDKSQQENAVPLQINEPAVPSLAEINAKAVSDKLNKKKSQSKRVAPPVVNAGGPPAVNTGGSPYPGKTIGAARIPAAEKGILEADQQVLDSTKEALPLLEKLKDKNSLGDRAKMELAWQQYQHGIEPSDPNIANIIRAVALIQTQGAGPWTRIGRSKYTFDVIQKHLPQPHDTPAKMYQNVKWLQDNVIPSSIKAMRNPGAVPMSSNAPKMPTESGKPSTQSLADRLNEALGK